MAAPRKRQLDPDRGANRWLLLATAILTLAVAAMIAWILIDNASQDTAGAVALLWTASR